MCERWRNDTSLCVVIGRKIVDDKRSNDGSAVMVRADGKVMEKSQLYTSELRIRKPRREMEAAGGKEKKKKMDRRKGEVLQE